MLKGIKNQLAARLQRQLIEVAIRTLYSEEFDFESILNRLSRRRDGSHLLRACIAIEIAARLTEPLTERDVKGAQKLVELVEASSDRSIIEQLIDIRRELAELFWSKATLEILRRKLAHKRDEESFEGTMYSLAREHRGPVAPEQRASFEKICAQLAEAKKNVEVAELEALMEQNPEEYSRYKDELDAYEMQNEIDSFDDEETDADLREGIEQLERKFSELLPTA